ncbi:MAG: 50S ribosomal protein L19 [Rikenellaceae bacterium]
MKLATDTYNASVGEVSARPSFKAGDTVTVTYKIIEGAKERQQSFRGVVIQKRGSGNTETFTVRKTTEGIGIERIFPINLPTIISIEVNKVGIVRKARIFYYRDLKGKKARIKEKRTPSKQK